MSQVLSKALNIQWEAKQTWYVNYYTSTVFILLILIILEDKQKCSFYSHAAKRKVRLREVKQLAEANDGELGRAKTTTEFP